MPAHVNKSALVPFSAAAMYELVQDVASYPAFLPWCESTEVEPAQGNEVLATIHFRRGPLRKAFSTRNHMIKDQRIEMRLHSGPFQQLEGAWSFEPLGPDGCKVSLRLDFEYANALLRASVGPLFNEIAHSMLNAFCQRARELYAEKNTD